MFKTNKKCPKCGCKTLLPYVNLHSEKRMFICGDCLEEIELDENGNEM